MLPLRGFWADTGHFYRYPENSNGVREIQNLGNFLLNEKIILAYFPSKFHPNLGKIITEMYCRAKVFCRLLSERIMH
jgi:hypothetical protein